MGDRFLVQSFCAELVSFEKHYKQYKGAISDTERYIVAATIVKMFLTNNAKNELNIKNNDIKQKILKKVDKIQSNKGSSKKRAPNIHRICSILSIVGSYNKLKRIHGQSSNKQSLASRIAKTSNNYYYLLLYLFFVFYVFLMSILYCILMWILL